MRVRKGSIFEIIATILFFGISCIGAQAATIHVPTDYSAIQAAINAASNGDTIVVAPGTYQGNIDFQGKAITVMSSGGPAVTTIDGGNTASVVVFDTNEGATSVLQGFTIKNGYGASASSYDGGGIYISSASPTIKGNTITNNKACAGSGIALYSSSPQITGNTITNNSQGGCTGGTGGGGILIQGTSTALITGNIISGNSMGAAGGGISLFDGGTPTIEANIITGNSAGDQGGGIAMVNSSNAIIVDNLISGNSSYNGGGGIAALVPGGNPGPAIVNNTITDNQDRVASGIYMDGFDSQTVIVNNIITASAGQTALDCDTTYSASPPVVQWNDAFSSSGISYAGSCAADAGSNGNISADPLFFDSTNNNFHLQYGSPAIDAGSNSAPDLPSTDLDGNPRIVDGNNDGTAVVDMGAYEFFPATATVSPTSLSFPDQAFGTSSASQPVTVTNTGSSALLLAISVTGDFMQTNDCGSSVAAGKSCIISVSFSPATRGTLTGKLTVVSNTTKSPAVVSLSGTGIGSAADISPLNMDFGNQLQGTTSSAQTVTVTNVGELPLSFTSISTTGDFAQTNNCTGGIATGASCTVSVTFTPSVRGKSVGSLTFTDNAADSPQAVVLTGTGFINPVPLLNEPVVPSSAAPGSPSFTLTVHGTAFVSGAAVDWNGTPLTTTFVNGSELRATVPASDVAAATTASIAVANPGPAGSTSNVAFFPVGVQVPSVTLVTSPASQYGVGSEPEAVATGDFNNDGRLDMAVTNAGGNYVTILLGNGEGTFSETSSGPITGAGPNSVVVGDFNNDGNLDLAVTNGAGNSVSILLGHGSGSFTAAGPPIPIGTAPDAIAAGDFNGDGLLDLAVADRGSNQVAVLLGNGDGTFTATGSPLATGTYPDSIAVGDFDGNGALDLAVANNGSNNITVMLGNGDGTFTPAAPSTTGTGPVSVAAADFDGDGKLDLAVTNATDNTVSILHGNGDGTFTAIGTPIATGRLPNGLAVGDYTNHGKPGLAVADNGSNSVTVLRGNGDGTFTAAAASTGTGAGPWAVVAGDFNGDGRLDLATANSLANTVSVLLQGQPSGLSLSPSSLSFSSQVVGTTSSAQSVTLTNNSASAVAISITMANSDFAETNTCGSSIAPASSCTINVTFDPTAGGSRVGTLSISGNASSNSLEVALSGTGEDFSMSAQSASATVSAGGTASYNLLLAPEGGFSGDVSLACSGAPSSTTCSLSPASVTLDGSNSAPVTLKVATSAASGALPLPSNPQNLPPMTVLWVSLVSLLGLGVLVRFLPSRVRTRSALLVPLAATLLAITFWTACGGGGSTAPAVSSGTQAGTYTLTVTAKSGSLTHSTTVSLTVQ